MSRLTRYTLVALGAIALSVTSYCIGNATAQEPSPTEHSNGIRTVELAPMPALGAESAYMGLLLERSRWDEALRWRALAQIAGAGEAAGSGGTVRLTSTTATAAPGPAASGDCSGFSVPDYIIQRESRGDPNAYNPSSGAIGCTQTLISHYQRGECQGLDPYSVEGQRECTYRLSDGGTNLAPWAG